MAKLDLTKEYKSYYTAKRKPELVEIPPAKYLSIRGKADPSSQAFTEKIQALYAVAYAVKFAFKALDKDYVVAKLEGQWWYDEEKFGKLSIKESVKVPRSEWEFRLLIRLPEFVGKNEVEEGIDHAFDKKGLELIKEVAYFEMTEGECVQMLHVGPFETEPESLEVIGKFMSEKGMGKGGHHHEIYLSDFRKTAPEKLKTILREPVG